jgi:predicted alpha/beta-fold hydrolase
MVKSFSAAWYARGPHAQTIWGRLMRPRQLVRMEREVVETPDGDELVLDHLVSSQLSVLGSQIHFVLLHGLEGSSHSVYIQGVLSIVAKRGLSATVMNFRSCARDLDQVSRMLPNRRPRLYHSGETTDFDFVVRMLAARMPGAKLVALGASLGGNALLKWLGEHPDEHLITAAATMSVPYDLAAGAAHLERGIGALYVSNFLRTLKKKAKDVVARYPDAPVDIDRAMRARTFREFDDAATAPLHGFKDADDYYSRSSSISYLGRITTPTLCVSAEDDPFLPREALNRALAAASPAIEFIITRRGGHTGFVSGRVPWRSVYWAEELVVEWLRAKIES